MKILDCLLLNTILTLLPIMSYLLYLAYKESFSKKENNLIFVLVIITQFYLIYKYGISLKKTPLLIINIPLIISYYKKKDRLIIISSIICIIYYLNYYRLPFLIIEYLIYFLLFKRVTKYNFTYILIIIKIIITLVQSNNIYISLTWAVILYILSDISIYMLEKGREIIKLHMSFKEIKKNSQIQKSLFQITHEIKNPIAVCKGYLDMYDENNPEKIRKHIPIIKEEIERTLTLLEDFLSLNRQKINKDILDINFLLEQVITNMNILFKKNNIELISKIEDEEIYIEGDYNRLMQVFINIFKNSIEALEKTKNSKIEVWTEEKENYIKIFIKDNGMGMDKETLSKIYEPFYTTKQRGTGLGVSLSNEIINAHGGTINYTSKQNKYTKAEIKLIKKAT